MYEKIIKKTSPKEDALKACVMHHNSIKNELHSSQKNKQIQPSRLGNYSASLGESLGAAANSPIPITTIIIDIIWEVEKMPRLPL